VPSLTARPPFGPILPSFCFFLFPSSRFPRRKKERSTSSYPLPLRFLLLSYPALPFSVGSVHSPPLLREDDPPPLASWSASFFSKQPFGSGFVDRARRCSLDSFSLFLPRMILEGRTLTRRNPCLWGCGGKTLFRGLSFSFLDPSSG